MASESDSDSSVVMLSDDEDDNVNSSRQENDDEKNGAYYRDVDESLSTAKKTYEEKKALGVDMKTNKLKKSSSLLAKSKDTSNVGSGQYITNLGDGNSEDDEDRLFEKNFQHDFNFVHAKFLVKKKVGFVCDVNSNLDPVERKIQKLLEQADIMILKKCLDAGGADVLSSYLDSKKIVPKPKSTTASKTVAPESPMPAITKVSPVVNSEFSDDDSPNTDQDPKNVGVTAPQMPVVDMDDNVRVPVPDLLEKKKDKNEFKFKPYNPPKKEKMRTIPKILKPAVIFPSIKSKSFKIPRAAKARLPRWISNGALWRWALAVDDNGQYSRSAGGRTKVPWAGMVTTRPCCEEYQDWLIRGTFSEGDDCCWGEEEIEKNSKEKTRMMREEMMWREKVLDKLLGKEPRVEGGFSARDPLGLDEKDSGTGTLEPGITTDDEVSVHDTNEELSENELNVSDQSLITHVRTPTHTFCVDEDEVNSGFNFKVSGDSDELTNEITNIDVDGSVPSEQVTEVVQPFPSPPPSTAPSTGFAFTRVAASNTVERFTDSSRTDAPQAASSPADDTRAAPAGDQSLLSTLVTSNKARLKLF